MIDDTLLPAGRVAQCLGISTQTLRRWCAAGLIKCQFTAGGHRRYRPSDVEALLRSLESEHGSNAIPEALGNGVPRQHG
jgi:excisionase family DNA binding protein